MLKRSSGTKDGTVREWRVLSEYESGRAQIAIEWVSRAQKPIVEVGGRPIKGCDFQALAADLNFCIRQSGESVRGFVMPDRAPGYCCYGFFRYAWALNALQLVWTTRRAPRGPYHSLWLQGLLFGYGAEAIQRFISSASSVPEPNSHWHPCNAPIRLCKVEICGSLVQLARLRSNRSGKYQTFG